LLRRPEVERRDSWKAHLGTGSAFLRRLLGEHEIVERGATAGLQLSRSQSYLTGVIVAACR
jgi:hypothetical protein